MSRVDFVVIAIIALILLGIVMFYVKKRKNGNAGGCGCGCSGCSSKDTCGTAHKE